MSVQVEMLETGRSTYDSTAIPPEAQRWMDECNFNWNWVSKRNTAQNNYRNKGYRPLFLKDVDDEKAREALLGINLDGDLSRGMIYNSDCVLMVRNKGEEKFWVIEERARARNMMGSTSIDAIAEEMNRRAHDAGHKDAISFTQKNEDAESHVHGGPTFAMENDPKLKEAVKAALSFMDPK